MTHSNQLKLTTISGKTRATVKLESQLAMVATVTAMGLASWRKSSATISHGMAPVWETKGVAGFE